MKENVFGRRVRVRTPGMDVMAYLPRGSDEETQAWPGQRIALEGYLREPRPARRPGGFDEAAFLRDQGVSCVFRARRLEAIDAAVPWRWRPFFWAEKAHRSVHRALRESFAPQDASVLEGMLLGYKGRLDRKTNRAIQDAGVMHLLVPSGAKVALVLVFMASAASFLRLGPKTRLLAMALGAGFYVLVVGREPPYTRAYLAALAVLGAQILERETQGFQALILSALVILVWNPADILSVGFQMTYAAVLGVLVAMPARRTPSGRRRPLRAAARALLVSLAVQIMLAPILARVFGRISLVGVLANAVLVPASIPLFASGFLAWALHVLSWRLLSAAVVEAAVVMTRGFVWACRAFASIPGAAVSTRPWPPLAVAAYYAAALGVLAVLSNYV